MRSLLIYIGIVLIALALATPADDVIQGGRSARAALPNIVLWFLQEAGGRKTIVGVGIALIAGTFFWPKKK